MIDQGSLASIRCFLQTNKAIRDLLLDFLVICDIVQRLLLFHCDTKFQSCVKIFKKFINCSRINSKIDWNISTENSSLNTLDMTTHVRLRLEKMAIPKCFFRRNMLVR